MGLTSCSVPDPRSLEPAPSAQPNGAKAPPLPTRSAPVSPSSPGTTTSTPAAPEPARESAPELSSEPPGSSRHRGAVEEEFAGRRPRHWGSAVPGVVTRGSALARSRRRVALTLDACGGGAGAGYDRALIEVLRDLRVPATLFLNARWVRANPSTTRDLARDPLFSLQSHGWRHVPLSVTGRHAYGIRGTGSVREAHAELTRGIPVLQRHTGRPVRWFRPGTAHCDEVASAMAAHVGTPVVGFSVNGDGGATFSAEQVARAVGSAGPGDIVIAHMNHPESGTAAGHARALPELLGRGLVFSHLDDMV